jgi:hypothetical protein
MPRENNPDIHVMDPTRQSDEGVMPVPQLTVKDQLGITVGVTRDKQPKTIEIDHLDCYAKIQFISVEDGGPEYIYYAKIGISGFLFDPWGTFSEGSQAKEAKHLGRQAWEFHKISKPCFDNYVRFLMTRNKAYFNMAEREVRTDG